MIVGLIAAAVIAFLCGFYLFICRAGYKRGYYQGYYDGNFFGVEDAKEKHQEEILKVEAEKRRYRQAAIKRASYLKVVK